jgi:acyl carrier protein
MEVRDRIMKCITVVLELDGEIVQNLKDDDSLIERGITSLNQMKILLNIEEEFHICFENEEMLIENFSTLSKIKDVVLRKLG